MIDIDDLTEFTTREYFLTISRSQGMKYYIHLSSACKEFFEDKGMYVKVLGNSKVIKIRPVKEKSYGSFKILTNKFGTITVNRSNGIVEQLKNIGWTFVDGRKFEGCIVDNEIVFYRNRILTVCNTENQSM